MEERGSAQRGREADTQIDGGVMAAISPTTGTAGAAPTIPPREILDRDAARVVRQITSFEAPPIPSLSPANARQLPPSDIVSGHSARRSSTSVS